MSDTLKWPTADELRSANGIGRLADLESSRIEKELVLSTWRNNIHSVLVDIIENKSQDADISVPAPTQDKALARMLAPVLVAWLQGVLPGMDVSIEPGEFYTSINIRWNKI